MPVLSIILIIVAVLVLSAGLSAVRQVEQYQRGVVFRFGKLLPEILGPGLHFIVPIADKMVKVNMQIDRRSRGRSCSASLRKVPSPLTT